LQAQAVADFLGDGGLTFAGQRRVGRHGPHLILTWRSIVRNRSECNRHARIRLAAQVGV
jgi:hypothetical protein